MLTVTKSWYRPSSCKSRYSQSTSLTTSASAMYLALSVLVVTVFYLTDAVDTIELYNLTVK